MAESCKLLLFQPKAIRSDWKTADVQDWSQLDMKVQWPGESVVGLDLIIQPTDKRGYSEEHSSFKQQAKFEGISRIHSSPLLCREERDIPCLKIMCAPLMCNSDGTLCHIWFFVLLIQQLSMFPIIAEETKCWLIKEQGGIQIFREFFRGINVSLSQSCCYLPINSCAMFSSQHSCNDQVCSWSTNL